MQSSEETFEFLTLQEASTLTGWDDETLRRAIRSGELTAINIGRSYQTKREWLQAFIDRRTINPEAAGPVELATSGK